MALKTFNVDAEAYEAYSKYCKKEGISMSKRVEAFIKAEVEKSKITKFFPTLKEATQIQQHIEVKDNEAKETNFKTDHKMSKYC